MRAATDARWSRWLPGPLARRPLAALLLLAAVPLLWNLGASGLWESTEARYAEIAARMLRSGDWLVPRLNYVAHFDKPPLTYWATAAGMGFLGIGEAGARLGLAAAALTTLAVVYRAGEAAGGAAAGAYALLALASSPLFVALARSVSTDMYLTLWIAVAVESARRGSATGAARGWRLAAWAALGLGFLTKGPIVLVWTALPAVVWAAWTGRWGRLLRLADPWGILLAVAVGVPWYAGMAARHPGLLEEWLGRQTAGRMFAAYEGERAPWWALLPVLGWGVGVWLVPAAAEMARSSGLGERGVRRRNRARFWLVWTVAPLIAFSLFPTKRANYLLPALVPLALAAGAWWSAAARGARPGRAVVARIVAGTTLLLGAGLAIAGVVLGERTGGPPAPLPALGLWLGPVFGLGGVVGWIAAGRRRLDIAFAATWIPLAGLYLVAFTALGRPAVQAHLKISRPLARAAAAHRIAAEPIVAAWDWPRAFPFYLDEPVITVAVAERTVAFEYDALARSRLHADEGALARFAGTRTLFFIPRGTIDRLEGRLGEPVVPLAATRRHLLVTNRPTAAEREAR